MAKVNQHIVPNCLRRHRRVRGLTQREVAQILGLRSASMISRWERGVCMPSSMNMLRLSLVYRTMVDALFVDVLRSLRDGLHEREGDVLRAR